MLWLIILGVLILLAVLPLGVSVRYDADGALVRVIAGPIRVTLFPRKKKEKPEKKKNKPKKTAEKPASKETKPPKAPENPKEKKGGSWTDFLPLVRIALNFLGDFRRKLRVKRLELKLILAGDDPADLGINYGRACAALGNLWPQLEKLFVIKKRDVQIECDFTADKTLVTACLDITITLGRVLALAAVYGVRALTAFLKIQTKRKGGATQ